MAAKPWGWPYSDPRGFAPKTEAAVNLQISLVLEVPIPGSTFPCPRG